MTAFSAVTMVNLCLYTIVWKRNSHSLSNSSIQALNETHLSTVEWGCNCPYEYIGLASLAIIFHYLKQEGNKDILTSFKRPKWSIRPNKRLILNYARDTYHCDTGSMLPCKHKGVGNGNIY